MRIAQIAPLIESVPPKAYGGTERVVHTLAEHLVRMGHDVTLFASGDSVTAGRLHSVYPVSLREAKLRPDTATSLALLNIGKAFELQDEFDIIHDHTGLSMPVANIARTPSLITLHGNITSDDKRVLESFKHPLLNSISHAQARTIRHLDNYTGNVYNGLDMEEYPFSREDDGYLLLVGRLSEEKGIHQAIEAAQYLNLPLLIAAKLDNADRDYFRKYVRPRISGRVRWVGEVDEEKRNQLMKKARCLLHPALWEEPFGLVLIEAMACGCPVIAYERGSIPEVIVHKKTGFIVQDIHEMIAAIQHVHEIDRAACRDHALSNFSGRLMAESYLKIYEEATSPPEAAIAAKDLNYQSA